MSGGYTDAGVSQGVSNPGAKRFALLTLGLFILGLAGGLVTVWHPNKPLTVILALGYGLASAVLILWGARMDPARSISAAVPTAAAPAIIVLAGLLTVMLAYGVLGAFPLSADEFGYTYLADTLRHGRLWNTSFPPELQDVLETVYVPDQEGKRLSQYPPGWPVVLALFPTVAASAIANSLLGLLSGGLLLLALRELRVPPGLTAALLIIALVAPFTLFNNASFFNHTLTGTCLLAVAYLDLRERQAASAWNQAGIGFAFSVLLTTRYEVFAVAFVLYVLDGLLRRRGRFITVSLVAAAAALPIVACFAYYNWRVTGSPFTTTLAWGAPNISYGLRATGMEGVNTPAKALERNGRFITWWAEFASCAILPFFAIGLWRRVTAWTVCWFDLMLPAIVVFFLFYPDGGGFQYGPRYWFAGWVMLPLTLGAGFAHGQPWTLARQSFDPVRLSVLQGAAYVGFTIGYAVFAYLQLEARQEPLRVAASVATPAMVLFADQDVRYVPWQVRTIPLDALDYTRNGPDGLGPIAFARDISPARTALLCQQVTDRAIWRLRLSGTPPVGRLEPAC